MPASHHFSHVQDAALPMESGIASLFGDAHLADAYAIAIPPGDPRDIRALAEAAMRLSTPWARALMRARDAIMGNLGVKTSGEIRNRMERSGNEHIHFFPVLFRSEREIIVGENDSHLDFRASLMLRQAGDGPGHEFIVTTVVHCHNRLGRIYLAAILPFHRLIIRSGLRHLAANRA